MSSRLTLGALRNDSRLTQVLNVCSDDTRLAGWVNNFEERAWSMGRWWGTTQLARFCISDGCIILPREIALIEQANLNGVPLRMNNLWYQFIAPHRTCSSDTCGSSAVPCNGFTRCRCGCGCGPTNMEDNGEVVSFATTVGTNKKIRIYPGNATDAGKTITIQGYDANGNWVRSGSASARVDGEVVTLAMPFVDTVTIWGAGAPTGVIKDETQYRVLVYALDTDDASETFLANYQPTETLPTYRRMFIPQFRNTSCGGCSTSTLTAIVSLQQVPVKYDSDWLLFQNLAAYKDGCMSEKYREEGNIGLADAYFYGTPRPARNGRGVLRTSYGMGALPLLEAELRRMTGDVTTIRMQHAGLNLAGFM